MQFIEGQTLAALIAELRSAAGDKLARAADPDHTGPYSPTPERAGMPAADAVTPPVAGLSTQRSTKDPAFFYTVAHLGIPPAEGLEPAHQLAVVHGAIKPANLLISSGPGVPPGSGPHLWITDFGLAHCQSHAGLTMTGDLVGTLRYMSPEQAMGKRALVDH